MDLNFVNLLNTSGTLLSLLGYASAPVPVEYPSDHPPPPPAPVPLRMDVEEDDKGKMVGAIVRGRSRIDSVSIRAVCSVLGALRLAELDE
jgi:hypothetical protein